MRLTGTWDRGPDPYGAKFIRDDFDVGLGPSRGFLRNRLNASLAAALQPVHPARAVRSPGRACNARRSSHDEKYHLLFLQQVLEWDTRDNRNSPTRGMLRAARGARDAAARRPGATFA